MSFYTMSRSGINNRTFNHSLGASLHIHFLTIAHHPSSRRYPHSPALNQIYYEQIPMWANDFLEVSVNVAQYHQYYQWYGYGVILIGTFYSLSLESNSKQLFFSHSSNFFATQGRHSLDLRKRAVNFPLRLYIRNVRRDKKT